MKELHFSEMFVVNVIEQTQATLTSKFVLRQSSFINKSN